MHSRGRQKPPKNNNAMNNIIENVVSTSKGWLLRQGIKWGASAGTAVSAAIITASSKANIDPSQASEIAAKADQMTVGVIGLVLSVAVALVEGWLSKKASKIAAK